MIFLWQWQLQKQAQLTSVNLLSYESLYLVTWKECHLLFVHSLISKDFCSCLQTCSMHVMTSVVRVQQPRQQPLHHAVVREAWSLITATTLCTSAWWEAYILITGTKSLHQWKEGGGKEQAQAGCQCWGVAWGGMIWNSRRCLRV